MTGANRLQVRPRGVAAITALMFVACSLAALRHEATTAHVRDSVGRYQHAPSLSGDHADGAGPDIHAQHPAENDGDCALLTALHQAASADVSAPDLHLVIRAAFALDATPGAAQGVARDVYRLAPKTSPPAEV